MTFEEWFAGLGRSYSPHIIWIKAQQEMRERCAELAEMFSVGETPITGQYKAKAIAHAIRALEVG